ncbi:hypothetical protein JOB18_019641 [Solea senegalensis]|uniref:Mitochondrial fission factor n=1 Tax=Solea senegalensis TaxID=28829 RepID=A0AAV6SFD7_SOLSE|nr:hypothetical protein JOB18_019641 [Solea senegalensis]
MSGLLPHYILVRQERERNFVYSGKMSQDLICDPIFMEIINKNMRVPDHLSVSTRQQWQREEGEQPPPVYSMQVPERLTYTEAPDMSPRPLFSPSKPMICGPMGLEPCWESPSGEVFYKEALQSPIRRSYSDQSFGRTPPGTPTKKKQALTRHPSSSAMDTWSPEEEGGAAAVEFIILRRQVMKMSRRLAALERHNSEHRSTEVILFSLLFSACLLNAWLWIRR